MARSGLHPPTDQTILATSIRPRPETTSDKDRRVPLPETIFQTPLDFVLACGVMIIAQLVYVMFGFGSGLIAVGTLALLFPDITDVVVVLLLVNLPAELTVAYRSRSSIRWRPIVVLGVGIALGIPVGTWLLSTRDPRIILTLLGWFLIVVGLVFLRLRGGRKREPSQKLAPGVGLVSGLLTGLFGTGGPPLIIWYYVSTDSKTAFRGNLMTIFLLMTTIRVPSYIAGGLVTAPRLWSTLALLPAVLVGAWLGHHLHIRISESAFRRIVALLLTALGVLLLLKHS